MAEAATDISPQYVLDLVRNYPHPRERVFAAWTQPAQLVEWWGPKGVHIPHYRMNVQPGGDWETTMRNENGDEFFVSGRYLEITPPEKLVFTWAWSNDGTRGHQTTVTVELREKAGGTEMALSQQIFESRQARDLHNEGWTSSLERLAEHVSSNAH